MSKSEPDLLDVAVVISLVVLALQYFLNWFALPWWKDKAGPDTYDQTLKLIRVGLGAALLAAVGISVVAIV